MENLEVAQKFIQYVEAGDVTKLKTILADDFSFNHKAAAQPMNRQQFLDAIKAIHSAMPDWRYNATNIKDGAPVSMTVQITGTHKGTLDLSALKMPVVPATQKRIKLPAEPCTLDIKGGKIRRHEVTAVPGGGLPGIFTQLGVKVPGQQATRPTHA